MARPIQNTPILKGEDARKFRLDLLESLAKQLTPQEQQKKKKETKEMEESYNLLVSISNGAFY